MSTRAGKRLGLMRGFDPHIQEEMQRGKRYVALNLLRCLMDCRAKPGNDREEARA